MQSSKRRFNSSANCFVLLTPTASAIDRDPQKVMCVFQLLSIELILLIIIICEVLDLLS